MTRPVLSQLLQRVRKTPKCWLWTGPLFENGYGNLSGKRAHRVMYELTKGPIDPGNVVRHKCHVRNCVRPGHLIQGTQTMNMYDSQPLKVTQVRWARGHFRRSYAKTRRDIAKKLGVSLDTVDRILAGRTWSHVKDAS